MFRGWYTVAEQCENCELTFEPNDGDTWAFMYVSTAGITGVFVLAMLFWLRPTQLWIGRAILLPAALLAIAGTLPRRKGIAIAIDYLSELLWNRTDDPAHTIQSGKAAESPKQPLNHPGRGK